MSEIVTEIRARVVRAAEAMAAAGLDGMVLGDKYNYWYFTGHLSREFDKKMRPMLVLLTARGETGVVCYRQSERDVLKTCPDARTFTYEDVPFDVEVLNTALQRMGLQAARVGMELGENERLGLPYHDLRSLLRANPALSLADAGPLVQGLRAVKSAYEIDALRAACDLSLKAWNAALARFPVGATNDEITRIVGTELAAAGSDPNIAGHVTVGNGVAGIEPYRPGEVIWCDFGGVVRGYQADLARRAVYGTPTEQHLEVHAQISDVFEAELAAIGPGVRASEVARAVSDRLEALGHPPLGPRKRVGHGLGLGAAEPPSLSLADDTVLQPGMVLTPEPRFTLANGEKVHIEEVVVVTETGCERLTDGATRLHVIEG
ncbi:MAG TPA: Xaa-Pro peptidase family protein [Egibacteraceae bacterium]